MFNSNQYDTEYYEGHFWDDLRAEMGSPVGCWIVFGDNIGWQNLSGYKIFRTDDDELEKFIREAVGSRSDYNFKLKKEDDTLYMTVFDHDSLTGESRKVIKVNNHVRNELEQFNRHDLLYAWQGYIRSQVDEADVKYYALKEAEIMIGKEDLRKLTKGNLITIWQEEAREERLCDTSIKDIAEAITYYKQNELLYRKEHKNDKGNN